MSINISIKKTLARTKSEPAFILWLIHLEGGVIHLILRSDDRNAFLDVMSLFDFVDHRDGVIRVGDNAFAFVVER